MAQGSFCGTTSAWRVSQSHFRHQPCLLVQMRPAIKNQHDDFVRKVSKKLSHEIYQNLKNGNWILFRYFISFVFIYGTKLYTKLKQYRMLSKSQNWPAKPWLFPRGFDEKLFPSCTLFRFWLIWLDNFDQNWNSHYDRNDLAGHFWQMESTLRKVFWLTCIG